METNKHIDNLIARFIAGEVSESEKQELTRWMEQNETNRKYFEGIQFANQQAIASHQIIHVDIENAWKSVHSKMQSSKEKQKNLAHSPIRLLPFWIRIAAAVVLISGISILIYKQINQTTTQTYESYVATSIDSIVHYTLTDSSVVTLNRCAQIAKASNYGKKERRVKLTGEAFFSVKPDPSKPFIVENGETFVRVTGTSFNIKGNESDSLIEVYVKTGNVLFFTDNNEGIKLAAGELGIYNKNSKIFTRKTIVDQNVTAYTNRVFVFYNTTLNEVFRQLNKVYGVTITPCNSELGLHTITVSFEDEDIETILTIIAETLNLKQKLTSEKHYQIEDPTCNTEEKIQ